MNFVREGIQLNYNEYNQFRIESIQNTSNPRIEISWISSQLNIPRQVIPESAFIHRETCDCGGNDFTGDKCEYYTNDCSSDPCMNGGTCIDGSSNFSCYCPSGYSGRFCEISDCTICKFGSKCQESQTLIFGLRANYYSLQQQSIPSKIRTESNIQTFENINFNWGLSSVQGLPNDW